MHAFTKLSSHWEGGFVNNYEVKRHVTAAGTITKSELGSFSPSQQFAFIFHELVWKGGFIWFWLWVFFVLFVFWVLFLGVRVFVWLGCCCWFCGGFCVVLGFGGGVVVVNKMSTLVRF